MRVGTLLTAVVVLMTVAVAFLPFQARAQTAQDPLIVGLQNDTPNLHPWDTATNSVWKAFVWRNWVYEGLFGLKPDGQYYPVLADPSRIGTTSGEAGWDTDATGLNITVYVRPGVTFTDGDPMDADDVVRVHRIPIRERDARSHVDRDVQARGVRVPARFSRGRSDPRRICENGIVLAIRLEAE